MAFYDIEQTLGLDVGAERRAAMTEVLRDKLTRAQLVEAVELLKIDRDLDDKIRYGRTLTPADFFRVLEHDGGSSKLYEYRDAADLMTKGAQFAPVQVKGREKPMWRRIG